MSNRIPNLYPGLIPPPSDRKPIFPVMPKLFGAALDSQDTPVIDRRSVRPLIGMYGNDRLSNCSSVAIANGINGIASLLWGTNAHLKPIITTSNVVYFYSQSTGYDPSNPLSDKGADADKVATFAARQGYPTHGTYLFPAVGEIDHTSLQALRDGVNAFGVLNLGVGLSINDTTNEIWDTGVTPNDRIGSYGWHLLNLWSWSGIKDDDLVEVLTFGRVQKVTWRWIRERTILAYGHAYHQLIAQCGKSFDHQGWAEYLTTCRSLSSSIT